MNLRDKGSGIEINNTTDSEGFPLKRGSKRRQKWKPYKRVLEDGFKI
jgi:hypothetical protein